MGNPYQRSERSAGLKTSFLNGVAPPKKCLPNDVGKLWEYIEYHRVIFR
jgi:hypothetical protein